jgi:hypothetical protein
MKMAQNSYDVWYFRECGDGDQITLEIASILLYQHET